jgi:hypothetical protein
MWGELWLVDMSIMLKPNMVDSKCIITENDLIHFGILCSKICLLLNTPAPVGTTLRCGRNSCRLEVGVPEKKFQNRTMHGWWGIRRQAISEKTNTFCTSKFPICKYGLQAFICSSYFQLIYTWKGRKSFCL